MSKARSMRKFEVKRRLEGGGFSQVVGHVWKDNGRWDGKTLGGAKLPVATHGSYKQTAMAWVEEAGSREL